MPETTNAHQPGDLASALNTEIGRRSFSQREAAEAMKITQQTLSRWLSRQLVPSPDALPPIARFLRLPIGEVRAMRAAAWEHRKPTNEGTERQLTEIRKLLERMARLEDAQAESLSGLEQSIERLGAALDLLAKQRGK